MHTMQQAALRAEMAAAKAALQQQCPDLAMQHLERAHVIGQAHVGPHVQTHWWMLKLEWQRRRLRAVAGQAVRIVLGALGSAVGVIPVGNTGGSDISMFRRLPVAPELQAVIDGKSPPASAINPEPL